MQGLVGSGLVDDPRTHGGRDNNRTISVIVDPKSVIIRPGQPSKIPHGGGTDFATALALLNTPRTLTEYTLLKSSLVKSRAGFMTETPAFCNTKYIIKRH